uniref:Uncharacterized protein n=1 Tax=Ascaris lumbricoides TaxID=6252 RepID=A0A0M3HJM6_ASCLU
MRRKKAHVDVVTISELATHRGVRHIGEIRLHRVAHHSSRHVAVDGMIPEHCCQIRARARYRESLQIERNKITLTVSQPSQITSSLKQTKM